MISNRKDPIMEEIENRIKNVIHMYKNKGMSIQDIRIYFLIPKNFKRLIKVLGDIHYIYKEQEYPIKFETVVYNMLFYCLTLERIPCQDSN